MNNRQKCKTKWCRRDRGPRSSYCNKCKHANDKARDPAKYCYHQLKRNAKRRGKVFTISLEYWRQFCYKSDYIQNKGKTHDSYTVDCIDPELGYIEGNIRALTNHENASKGNRKLVYCWQTRTATVVKINHSQTDGPF